MKYQREVVAERLHTERALVVALVLFAAALSTVITNDVALFITVPLTLSLRLVAKLPLARLVVFQALAVNAGSAISPIGNPQNLFLWQSSGAGFLEFVLAMAPLSLALMVLLLASVWLGFALSQLISNVPAAIFLETFSDDWRTLAWGVSVGGFGLAIGSMANLIALRLAREPGIWREFHIWSLPMLFLSIGLGAGLLRLIASG